MCVTDRGSAGWRRRSSSFRRASGGKINASSERFGLAAEQQQQIRDLVYDGARRMIDLKAAVDRSGLDLAEVVNSSDFDPEAVRAAYAVFQTARQKLENERFEMLLEVRQVLTNEQWQKLQELKRRMQQNRGQQRRPGQRPQGESTAGPLGCRVTGSRVHRLPHSLPVRSHLQHCLPESRARRA